MSIRIKLSKSVYEFYNRCKKYFRVIILVGIFIGIIVSFKSGSLEIFFTKRLISDYKYTPWSDTKITNSQQPNNSEISQKNELFQRFTLLVSPDLEGYNFFHEGLGFQLKLPKSFKVKVEKNIENKIKQVHFVDEKSGRVIKLGSMGGFHSSMVFRDACESLAMEDGRGLSPFEEKGCHKINNAHALKFSYGHQKGDCLGMGCEDGEVDPSVTTTEIYVEWTLIRNPYDRNSVNFSYSTEGDDFRKQQIWFDDIVKTFKFLPDFTQEDIGIKNSIFKNSQFSFEYINKLPLFLSNKHSPLSYKNFIEGCVGTIDNYIIDADSVCLYYPNNDETMELGFKGGGFVVSRLIYTFDNYSDKVEKCLYEASGSGTASDNHFFKEFPAREYVSNLPDAKIKVYAIYAHNHCYKITQSMFFNENKNQNQTNQKLSEYTSTVLNELDEILNTLTFYE